MSAYYETELDTADVRDPANRPATELTNEELAGLLVVRAGDVCGDARFWLAEAARRLRLYSNATPTILTSVEKEKSE